MTGSRLNHFLMIHICKEEHDKIDTELITNTLIKVRSAELLLLGCTK